MTWSLTRGLFTWQYEGKAFRNNVRKDLVLDQEFICLAVWRESFQKQCEKRDLVLDQGFIYMTVWRVSFHKQCEKRDLVLDQGFIYMAVRRESFQKQCEKRLGPWPGVYLHGSMKGELLETVWEKTWSLTKGLFTWQYEGGAFRNSVRREGVRDQGFIYRAIWRESFQKQ